MPVWQDRTIIKASHEIMSMVHYMMPCFLYCGKISMAPKILNNGRIALGLFCSILALSTAHAQTIQPYTKDRAPDRASTKATKAAVRGVQASSANVEQIMATAKRSRSEQSVNHTQLQRLLPGINPLKALEILPGVVFENADPWGNNEQNSSLYIHGFNQNQLGFTLDGVPLGDQSYGNYNGLSPQRAALSV